MMTPSLLLKHYAISTSIQSIYHQSGRCGLFMYQLRLLATSSKKGRIYRKGRRPANAVLENAQNRPPMTDIGMGVAPQSNPTNLSTVLPKSNSTIDITTSYNPMPRWKEWMAKHKPKNTNESTILTVLRWIVPKRYRFPNGICNQMYSYQQGILIGQRLMIWLVLVVSLIVYDETSPYELIGVRGPSMIPTMAADGSDLWLCRIYPSWLRYYYDSINNPWILWFIQPKIQRGTIIGFAHPDSPNSSISMKRIVGLPGDRIQRYGQYVHLYVDQDPDQWGITWPTSIANDTNQNHTWILSRKDTWDTTISSSSEVDNNKNSIRNLPKTEAMRTMIVPDGHVWIEADCPALGLDSRQFGPIPISWIRTRVIAKVWPLQHNYGKGGSSSKRWYHRPHPIPLDVETLMDYNVYYKQ